MLYKYEMHVHDSLCSRCGHNPPEVIAKVYYCLLYTSPSPRDCS